jgi:CBS domain-containing protein
MRVEEVMSRSVKTVSPSMPVADAAERMRLGHLHHLVVEHAGELVGVLSEPDLRGKRHDAIVGDVMSASVVTVEPDAPVEQAAILLRGRNLGCLPVVEDRHLIGIITVADLLELLGKGTRSDVPVVSEGRRKSVRHSTRRSRHRR